jgi:DNA end-binding protein Ku
VYFDKPYLIAPADQAFSESFAVLREGMRKKNVAALARAVLFRRVRTVMLRAHGCGIVAHTLNFDYEVRPAADAFDELPKVQVGGEMLDLAKHIIGTKSGAFDPRDFDDRYDTALVELVQAKIEGREIRKATPPKETKVTNLMDALRESAKAAGKTKPPAPSRKTTAAASRSGKKSAPSERRKTG